MSTNLATIQKIKNVRKHPNADSLDLVQVLGWQVVTKRDEYKENDLCVYIAIDTIVPDKPEFEFLRNKNFRIKPIRLRKEESAGICFPLSILPGYQCLTADGNGCFRSWIDSNGENKVIFEIGDDISDLIGVKHYEKPVPAELVGQVVGGLPGFLIMTDELNLRSYPEAVPELYGRPYYITRKQDGSSGTYFIRNGEFGVCSRRIQLKESETNGFWRMARKYNIEVALKKTFPNMDVAVQGECVGPGVQGNRIGLKELEFHVFSLFDIVKRHYLEFGFVEAFCKGNNIPMVPLITAGNVFPHTLEELITMANGEKYPNGNPAEGIVIRPMVSFYSQTLKKEWSGKVLNENYKEKD